MTSRSDAHRSTAAARPRIGVDTGGTFTDFVMRRGGPHGPGASAVHTHMTNTWNTPVEVLEDGAHPCDAEPCERVDDVEPRVGGRSIVIDRP